MLRKSIVIILVSILFTVTSFAQTANKPAENVVAKTDTIALPNFTKDKPSEVDFKKFDKETSESYAKKKRSGLSTGAKVGIIAGVVVAAVVIIAIVSIRSIDYKPDFSNLRFDPPITP